MFGFFPNIFYCRSSCSPVGFVVSRKKILKTSEESFVSQEGVEKTNTFSEFFEEVRPLLKDPREEVLGDIEALKL